MKTKTHIYMANLLIEDVKVNRIVLPKVGTFGVPPMVGNAIVRHPGAFRAGAVGPDFYPDILLGQGTIHAEESSWWLNLMFNRLGVSETSEREKNLAFTLGYMVHYAGDLFGHAYVNSYAGGWFPAISEIPTSMEKAKIATRHMLVEEYMDKRVPASASMRLEPPIDFLRDVFTCNDAQNLMLSRRVNDTFYNPLGKFINLRNDVHDDLMKAWIGMTPLVTKYVQNWEMDVDSGIKSWLVEWNKAAQIFAEGGNNSLSRVKNNFVNWFLTKYLSMIGLPDFIGQTAAFLRNINLLGPLEELLDELEKMFYKAIARAVLGKTYDDVAQAIADIKMIFSNPKTYLDNGTIFPERNISAKLDADFGNYGMESETTNQTFLAVTQCLNMSKLCLLGVDNLNAIGRRHVGNYSFYSKPTFFPGARLGYVTVKTSGSWWSGTDNNVYIGIRYDGGRVYEVLCDKFLYNDFERGDVDTYSFHVPENVSLNSVTAIRVRMSGRTPAGDWKCDWIEIKDHNRNVLFRVDNDFWLKSGEWKDRTDLTKFFDTSLTTIPVSPKIINFMFSLDGKGLSDANPATEAQWEFWGPRRFELYSHEVLRENVFNPLFVSPALMANGQYVAPNGPPTRAEPGEDGAGRYGTLDPYAGFEPREGQDPWESPELVDDPVWPDYTREVKGILYYLNKKANWMGGPHHELHKFHCSHIPSYGNRISLGLHESPKNAARAAKNKVKYEIDGCYYCCGELHNK
ncbi:MAG: zinc dependent phospholipase C family protein [Dehalococcoidia bacterium]|nr:zinc dependent phospholipase C family protein [Dehalococcoidia bacterium]